MGTTILIGERDETVRGPLLHRLAILGFETYGAADGLSCLSTAKDVHPDAVIVDVDMPWGGDGIVDRLRDRASNLPTPLILATGNAARDDLAARTALPPEQCFSKPYRSSSLLRLLIARLGDSSSLESLPTAPRDGLT